MDIFITLPEDIAHQIESKWENLPQRALEALMIEAYRSGIITESEVQRILNLSSRWELDEFLKRSHVYLEYTEADLQNDINSIRKLAGK
jgi:predicted HTH domain antitoxin